MQGNGQLGRSRIPSAVLMDSTNPWNLLPGGLSTHLSVQFPELGATGSIWEQLGATSNERMDKVQPLEIQRSPKGFAQKKQKKKKAGNQRILFLSLIPGYSLGMYEMHPMEGQPGVWMLFQALHHTDFFLSKGNRSEVGTWHRPALCQRDGSTQIFTKSRLIFGVHQKSATNDVTVIQTFPREYYQMEYYRAIWQWEVEKLHIHFILGEFG